MKIAIACDHAGFEEKERLKPLLRELGIQFEDLGTISTESVDYPDYARKVGDEVRSGRVEQGLLVCGSGTGMAIAALESGIMKLIPPAIKSLAVCLGDQYDALVAGVNVLRRAVFKSPK